MSLALLRERIPSTNSWLLTAVFVCIPLQVAPAYLLSAAMLALWVVDGRVGEKLRALAASRWCGSCSAITRADVFDAVDRRHRLGLADGPAADLLPAVPAVFQRRAPRALRPLRGCVPFSIAACEALAYYNWIQLHWLTNLPAGIHVNKTPGDTAPFVDRIMYTPALALAGYLAGHRLLFESTTLRQRALYGGLLAATVLNLLIAGGRAGMVGFLALLVLLVFQRFARRPVAAAALAAALVGAIVIGGYHASSDFKARVDDAVEGVARSNNVRTRGSACASSTCSMPGASTPSIRCSGWASATIATNTRASTRFTRRSGNRRGIRTTSTC